MELAADTAVVGDARRPGDDGGGAAAAARGHPLAVGERRGGGVGPGGGIGAVRLRAAQVVDVAGDLVERFRDAVEVAQLVQGAVQATLGRGAVVAGDVDDQRVLEIARLLDGLDDAAGLVIGVLERAAEDLHPAGADLLVGVAQFLPRRDARGAWRELGVGRDDPEFLLACQGALTEPVIAVVELASVSLHVLARHADRRLVPVRREVRDPRLLGMDRLLPLDPGDRPVGHVGLQVIALLRRSRRLQRRRVLPQRRMPLAHAGAEEPVEVLGAHAARPAIERSGDRGLVHRGEVGLADPGRAVPVLAQDLEHGRGAARDHRVVAREPGRALRDHAHADRMGVAPGQQAGTRRRAHGRDVIVRVLQALLGQPVEGRRTRRPAERTHVPVADVVADDDQHIGRALRRSQRLGKIGRRVREGHIDLAPERRVGRRQDRSLLVRFARHAISLSLKNRPVSAVRHHDLCCEATSPPYCP